MMEEKRVVGKPFQKGPDKRRNTKGRPKSFDKLRELAKQIAIEEVELKDKDGHTTGDTITVIEAILRGWAKDKKYQEKFVEYAYGKAPSSVDVTSGGEKVYEPFAGTGTTGIACQNLGRQARMVEISPAYCAVILERFTQAFPALEITRYPPE